MPEPITSTTDTTRCISTNLKHYMQTKKINQTQLVQECHKLGLTISQASISNAIHGNSNTTLAVLSKICAGLGIEVRDLFQPLPATDSALSTPDYLPKLPTDAELLITNPNDRAFGGYLGAYHVYFYQTTGNSSTLVHGYLSFHFSEDKQSCHASLKIPISTSNNAADSISIAYKEFSGQLLISAPMRTAYCQLYSKEIGEFYQILFRHWYLLNNNLKCTMACAATTCSGSNRRPTIHRICMTREPIAETRMNTLKGQLLLNDGDIIVSRTNLQRFIDSPSVSDAFKKALKSSMQAEPFYLFKESALSNANISENEQIALISSLRALSTAQKYNKISKRTEDALYALLYD